MRLTSATSGEVKLPSVITADEPLTMDQAIETALANNDTFHATLAQMGMGIVSAYRDVFVAT